jgi:hypothetical protein
MKLKIKNISIQIIPLHNNSQIKDIKSIGKIFHLFLHPMFTVTFSHIAIQMTLENNIFAIIEYGKYFTKESDEPDFLSKFFSSSMDSDDCIKEENELMFYYINKDGARLTFYDCSLLSKLDENFEITQRNDISRNSLAVMASKYYQIKYEEFYKEAQKEDSSIFFSYIECDIANKISLEDLCNNFKGEEWEAKKYDIWEHNCQHFAAKVIEILKAKRIHDIDKIRMNEKEKLPNCIINALWNNEELSKINTLGRIPIIGGIFDLIAKNIIKPPYSE